MSERRDSDHLVGRVFEGAFVTRALLLGDKVGLVSKLSTTNPSNPLTSNKLADGLGLRERYVREWLGVMVTGGIVRAIKSQDEATSFYMPEQISKDLAALDFASVLAVVPDDDEMAACFRVGGPPGVSPDKYVDFYRWMNGELRSGRPPGTSKWKWTIDHFLTAIPELGEKLSVGGKLLDIGCGRGGFCIELASLYEKAKFRGIDISDGSIDMARKNAEKEGVGERCEFLAGDCSEMRESAGLEWDEQFDVVMSTHTIHEVATPEKILADIKKFLRPDGILIILEMKAHSKIEDNVDDKEFKRWSPTITPAMLYTVSMLHCVPIALHRAGDDAGDQVCEPGLGAMWGKEGIVSLLETCGFSSVKWMEVAWEAISLLYTAKK